jgi:hypothetical protein
MIPIASHPFETSFAVINDVVFRSADTQATLQAIARDLDLWSHRYRSHVLRQQLSMWRAHVINAASRHRAALSSS